MVLETAELWLLVADKRHNLETAEKVTRLPLLTIFFFSDIFQAFLHCVWYLKILQRRDIYTLTRWEGTINAILLFWSTFDKSENAGWGELLLRKLAGATKAWMQWCIFMIVFLCICVCVCVCALSYWCICVSVQFLLRKLAEAPKVQLQCCSRFTLFYKSCNHVVYYVEWNIYIGHARIYWLWDKNTFTSTFLKSGPY